MTDDRRLSGDLQLQLMNAIWRLGSGTVAELRAELPPRYQAKYNTIQTVLNRLAKRRFLSRRKVGTAIEYRPTLSEADYIHRSITSTLAGASADARRSVLAGLIAGSDAGRGLPPNLSHTTRRSRYTAANGQARRTPSLAS